MQTISRQDDQKQQDENANRLDDMSIYSAFEDYAYMPSSIHEIYPEEFALITKDTFIKLYEQARQALPSISDINRISFCRKTAKNICIQLFGDSWKGLERLDENLYEKLAQQVLIKCTSYCCAYQKQEKTNITDLFRFIYATYNVQGVEQTSAFDDVYYPSSSLSKFQKEFRFCRDCLLDGFESPMPMRYFVSRICCTENVLNQERDRRKHPIEINKCRAICFELLYEVIKNFDQYSYLDLNLKRFAKITANLEKRFKILQSTNDTTGYEHILVACYEVEIFYGLISLFSLPANSLKILGCNREEIAIIANSPFPFSDQLYYHCEDVAVIQEWQYFIFMVLYPVYEMIYITLFFDSSSELSFKELLVSELKIEQFLKEYFHMASGIKNVNHPLSSKYLFLQEFYKKRFQTLPDWYNDEPNFIERLRKKLGL